MDTEYIDKRIAELRDTLLEQVRDLAARIASCGMIFANCVCAMSGWRAIDAGSSSACRYAPYGIARPLPALPAISPRSELRGW